MCEASNTTNHDTHISYHSHTIPYAHYRNHIPISLHVIRLLNTLQITVFPHDHSLSPNTSYACITTPIAAADRKS